MRPAARKDFSPAAAWVYGLGGHGAVLAIGFTMEPPPTPPPATSHESESSAKCEGNRAPPPATPRSQCVTRGPGAKGHLIITQWHLWELCRAVLIKMQSRSKRNECDVCKVRVSLNVDFKMLYQLETRYFS